MTDTFLLSRIIIEVTVPDADKPVSDEAWLAADWEVKLDELRDHIELAIAKATPAGTTVTIIEA